jgi:hypothetical protein
MAKNNEHKNRFRSSNELGMLIDNSMKAPLMPPQIVLPAEGFLVVAKSAFVPPLAMNALCVPLDIFYQGK